MKQSNPIDIQYIQCEGKQNMSFTLGDKLIFQLLVYIFDWINLDVQYHAFIFDKCLYLEIILI